MSEKLIAVGVVGCGGAGRGIHMPRLIKHKHLFRVTSCADTLPAASAALARDFGFRALDSVDRLLADNDVELVIVATRPPVTHRDIALKALQSGKHVVVEKPMADNEAQCGEMVDAAASARCVLAVHHNRRWDVDFLTARHIIESEAVGQVRLVRNEYVCGYSGSPYDWGIHLIDQTMALSRGKRFVEVTATFCKADANKPTESQGFFTARLRTEDGVIHDVSMLPAMDGNAYRPGKMAYRFMIAGTEGVVYQEWCQRPEDAVLQTAFMQAAKPGRHLGDLPFVSADLAIPDFYQSLYAAIRDGGPVPVSGSEGRRAVQAWELICRSACENRMLSISL